MHLYKMLVYILFNSVLPSVLIESSFGPAFCLVLSDTTVSNCNNSCKNSCNSSCNNNCNSSCNTAIGGLVTLDW